MSQQITTSFVKQFSDNVRILAQQKKSRFRNAVRNETIRGEEAFFDQLGSVIATARTTRHADTPITDTPHARRHVTTLTYEHADLIDDSDKIRTLVDPASDYVRVFAAAFGRAMDDAVINAAFGTAYTGKTGGTGVAFSTTASTAGGFRVDAAVGPIGMGDTGMNTHKMMEAKRVLDANENDAEEGYYVAMKAFQISDLLTEEVTDATSDVGLAFAPAASGDYMEKKGLATGELSFYAGLNIIRSERILNDGTYDRCIVWAKNDLLLAVGKDNQSRISERADKSYSTQVFHCADFGATRLTETGVVEIECVD